MKHLPILFTFILAGCSNLPVAIQDSPQPDISLSQTNQNMAQHQNQTVRWGGKIVQVENDNAGSTIHIVQLPLKHYGRPDADQYKNSAGRFIVITTKYLDPQIYQQDRLITISGTISGERNITVDKREMQVPVVNLEENYLWPEPVKRDDGIYIENGYFVDPYWRLRNNKYDYY